jgi:hypothetical protein
MSRELFIYKKESEEQWHMLADILRFEKNDHGDWKVPGIPDRSFFSLLEATKAFMKHNDEQIELLVEGREAEHEAQSSDEQLLVLLRQHKLIHAIKLRREQTGEPLIDAKYYVEQLAVQHGIRQWRSSRFDGYGYRWNQ